MKYVWQCLVSPRLYKIYKDGPSDAFYQPHVLEKYGDRIITWANMFLNICIYTSPFICIYVYRRAMTLEEVHSMGRLVGGLSALVILSFLARGIGRAWNPKYRSFLNEYYSPLRQSDLKAYLNIVRKYDFSFAHWPATYTVPQAKQRASSWKSPFRPSANSHLPKYQQVILQSLAFAATHTFGLNLIYPGKVGLIQTLLASPLLQGRTQLVEEFDGKRTKVVTADGNEIDTMFVRNKGPKGDVLVICCEGNSGFYEIGIMTTPIRAGYSALGWNHPGFAGSTGTPFPEQEETAIDAVIQYSINELGFQPEKIVMFGWSIGGYSAAWAANQYPVKGLILDATFDDLLPLAENQMPRSWRLLVKEVVRSYVDLHVAGYVTSYSGPLQLIRRAHDEIICLRPGQPETNRGNDLLVRLLLSRHPETQASGPLETLVALDDSQRASLERSNITEIERSHLQLIKKYMKEYKSSHCTPLPAQMFEIVMAGLVATPKKEE